MFAALTLAAVKRPVRYPSLMRVSDERKADFVLG